MEFSNSLICCWMCSLRGVFVLQLQALCQMTPTLAQMPMPEWHRNTKFVHVLFQKQCARTGHRYKLPLSKC